MTNSSHQITQLLKGWVSGDQAARDQVMPLVYEELRRMAHRHMRKERPGHTLQTSALVNEAFVRLVDQREVQWQNRAHFFGIAAQMMRRILSIMREVESMPSAAVTRARYLWTKWQLSRQSAPPMLWPLTTL
jgi:RNA polymerase sigma factor (TIGR02999 family)